MEKIGIWDARIQDEKDAAKRWVQSEAEGWLYYIDPEAQKEFQKDNMWNDLLHLLIYAFRLYGHALERTVRMAGLMCLLRCSSHLHDLVPDGVVGVDKKVQYRLLVGDQIMVRALELLTEDEAWVLIPYFSRIVVKMSEGKVLWMEKNQIDTEVLEYTHAPWYEAAFYSAACLAHRTELEQKRVGKLGFKLGILIESKRRDLSLETSDFLTWADWKILPDGWEKDALIEISQVLLEKNEQNFNENPKIQVMK